ncbi:MAG: hypothetical protein ACE37K_26085 [Planctomycetota bacterium]
MKTLHSIPLALLALAAACSAPGADVRLQNSYLVGDFDGAEAVVRDAGYGDSAELESSHFLDAMNRGMIRLAEADGTAACEQMSHGQLYLKSLLLTPRGLAGTATEAGISMLGDDYALEYTVLPYEVTIAESMLALAHVASSTAATRKEHFDQARNYSRDASSRSIAEWSTAYFGEETAGTLGDGFRVDHTHTGLAHFIYASCLEHVDGAQAAKLFEEAAKIEDLPGIRAHAEKGAPAPGTQPVWVYVVDGPGVVRVREDLKAGRDVQTLVRYFYTLQRPGQNPIVDLVPTMTFPVPALAEIENGVQQVMVAVDGGQPTAVPLIADIARTAQSTFDIDRDVRIARQIVRRMIREGGRAVVKNNGNSFWDWLAGLFNQGATALERADLRAWQTMPAGVRAVRLDLPAGRHRVDLDVRGSAGAMKIASASVPVKLADRPAPSGTSIDIEVPEGGVPAFVVAVVPSAACVGTPSTNHAAAAVEAAPVDPQADPQSNPEAAPQPQPRSRRADASRSR